VKTGLPKNENVRGFLDLCQQAPAISRPGPRAPPHPVAASGNAVKKREDVHRMAEANKAFAHYRW